MGTLLIRGCSFSSYVASVPIISSLSVCYALLCSICCAAGAISACHPTEPLLASSVVSRQKKSLSLYCVFIHHEFFIVSVIFCLSVSPPLYFLSLQSFSRCIRSIVSCLNPFTALNQFFFSSCESVLFKSHIKTFSFTCVSFPGH